MQTKELSERPVQVLDTYKKNCPICHKPTNHELLSVREPKTSLKKVALGGLLLGMGGGMLFSGGDGYFGYFEHCKVCDNTFAIKSIGRDKAKHYGWDTWQGYKNIPQEQRALHLIIMDSKEQTKRIVKV